MNVSRSLALALMFGALAGGQVWVAQLRYDLSVESQSLQKEQEALKLELSKLGLEVASLTSPERLRKYAGETLGMASPRPMQVLRP